jgi:hypothetical protein
MECQFSGNRPGRTSGSPIGPHTDSPNSRFAELLYLRDPNDRTSGGDLELWKWRDEVTNRKKIEILKESTTHINASWIELSKTVPYASNLLVLFPNSRESVHAVSVREPTNNERLFFNFGGDLIRLNFFQSQRTRALMQNILYIRNLWRAREDSNFQPSDP